MITLDHADGVATITLAGPERGSALSNYRGRGPRSLGRSPPMTPPRLLNAALTDPVDPAHAAAFDGAFGGAGFAHGVAAFRARQRK